MFYNVFYILSDISMFNSIEESDDLPDAGDHTYTAVSVSYYMGSMVGDSVGICAAIILGIGNCV